MNITTFSEDRLASFKQGVENRLAEKGIDQSKAKTTLEKMIEDSCDTYNQTLNIQNIDSSSTLTDSIEKVTNAIFGLIIQDRAEYLYDSYEITLEPFRPLFEISRYTRAKNRNSRSYDTPLTLNLTKILTKELYENEKAKTDLTNITGIDANLFNSLKEKGALLPFLKDQLNIPIEVSYNKKQYHIQSKKLFQSEFLEALLSEKFQSGHQKNKLFHDGKTGIQLNLNLLSQDDSLNKSTDLLTPFLTALEAADLSQLTGWNTAALILAYVGANYLDYTALAELLLSKISQKKIESEELFVEIEESFSLLHKINDIKSSELVLLRDKLFQQLVSYSLFSKEILSNDCIDYGNEMGFSEFIVEKKKDDFNLNYLNFDKLSSILCSFPHITRLTIKGHDFTSEHLKKICDEKAVEKGLKEIVFGNISFTLEQLSELLRISHSFDNRQFSNYLQSIDGLYSNTYENLPAILQEHPACIVYACSKREHIQPSTLSRKIVEYIQSSALFRRIVEHIQSSALSRKIVKYIQSSALFRRIVEYIQSSALSRKIKDKSWVVKTLPIFPNLFKYIKNYFNDDPEIVKIAVAQNGLALEFVSERLKDDPEIVKIAVAQNGLALQYANDRLKDDPEVAKIAVAQNGLALQFASERLQDNDEVAKIAVAQNGLALEFASERLKNDPEIVKRAVAQNVAALQFAGYTLRNDLNFIKMIVAQNVAALQFAEYTLRNDPNFIKMIVEQNVAALQFAGEPLRNDPDFIKMIVEQNRAALQFAGEPLRNDLNFIKMVVAQNGLALQYVNLDLRDDPEIVSIAVEQNGLALQYVNLDLRDDPEIVAKAVVQNGNAIQFATKRLKKNPEIVKTAIEQMGLLRGLQGLL